MKICQPAETEQGTNSALHGHFRSAPRYVIFNTNTDEIKLLNNKRKVGDQDICGQLSPLGNQSVDIAIVGGVGLCTLNKMQRCGIKVYRAMTHRLEENVELLKKGELTELTPQNIRRGHLCSNA